MEPTRFAGMISAHVDVLEKSQALIQQLDPDWREEFLLLREIPGRGLCGIQRFIYTCGLITNMRFEGSCMCIDFDARYCYPLASEAIRDLIVWDGEGDPPGGWIKEKLSGRKNESHEKDR